MSSPSVMIQTLGAPFRKMRTTNTTDSAFTGNAARIPTITLPDGVGDAAAQTTSAVHRFGLDVGSVTANGCLAVFYATGADNVTFNARCYAWTPQPGSNSVPVLWVPVLLCEVALIASTIVGVAGAPVVATERFADTVTLTIGNANISIETLSPGTTTANSGIAHVLLDFKGPQLIEWVLDVGTATDANGLFKPI